MNMKLLYVLITYNKVPIRIYRIMLSDFTYFITE